MGAASTSTHTNEDASHAPTRQLVSGPVGDRCTNCGAPLASDQRYCVHCGERRGKPRFTLGGTATEVVQTNTDAVRQPRRRPVMSSGSAFIAGVGVLLLAMGVGVLIGRLGQTNSPRMAASPPVQVVTVGGGGSGSGANSSGSTDTTSSGASGGSHKKSAKAAANKKVVVTKQVQAKATAAASKVVGGSAKLAAPTVTQGGSCTGGTAGCQGGSFTGNFFGQ